MNPEEPLRRAFHAQAQRIQPSHDALATIRARIARRAHLSRRITVGFASLSSAAVVTVTAVIVGAVSCAPPTTPEPLPPAGTTTSPSVPATEPTSTQPAGQSDRVPVYYLGEVGDRIMLYREFRTVTPADGTLPARIAAAVTEMLRDDPLDPDYFGAWPDGATVREVRVESNVAVVDLGGIDSNSAGAETATMTVEQLVWTVTAVAADAGSPVDGVRLLVDGSSRAQLWGHVAIGGVLRRSDASTVQAPVWLISPQHGDTVGGDGPLPDVGDGVSGREIQIHVDGRVFEATVNLRVLGEGGAFVGETFVTLSAGAPDRGEATTTMHLHPGRYTIEAFVYSMADGSVQAMDDHEITVT